MTWCLCCGGSKAPEKESPLIDMQTPVAEGGDTKETTVEDDAGKSSRRASTSDSKKTYNVAGVESGDEEKNDKNRGRSSKNTNWDDDTSTGQSKNLKSTRWAETSDTNDLDILESPDMQAISVRKPLKMRAGLAARDRFASGRDKRDKTSISKRDVPDDEQMLEDDGIRKPKPFRRGTFEANGETSGNGVGGENLAADNKWDLDGDEHVEITKEYGYISPDVTGNVDNTCDEEVPDLDDAGISPSSTYAPNDYGSVSAHAPKARQPTRSRLNNDDDMNESGSMGTRPVGRPPGPRGQRPQPLRRGAKSIPVRSRMEPAKPTAASTTKLMEKLITLGESKWSEQIKCQNELCNIAENHSDILRGCDPSVLVEAMRAITMQANSGRSNVSKGGITCLGNFYKACGTIINAGHADVIEVCTRKAASGSADFICTAANNTLAKICSSGSEVKLTTILLQKYKGNKAAQGVVLNCIIMLLDRLGPDAMKLKTLPDILTIAVASLTAGSLALRGAGKIIIGQINEQSDVIQLLNKMRKGDDAARVAGTALKKYKSEEKDKYLQNLKNGKF